jgi:hypothetical protein
MTATCVVGKEASLASMRSRLQGLQTRKSNLEMEVLNRLEEAERQFKAHCDIANLSEIDQEAYDRLMRNLREERQKHQRLADSITELGSKINAAESRAN